MTKGILIPFDDDEPIREVEFGDFRDMRDLIGCTYVDRMQTPNLTFWLDDEGLFHPERHQRTNARAMQLLCHDMQRELSEMGQVLVGDYLIDGLPDDEGEETDVPDWVKDFPFTWSAKPAEGGAANG